jgi:hypothetical protein
MHCEYSEYAVACREKFKLGRLRICEMLQLCRRRCDAAQCMRAWPLRTHYEKRCDESEVTKFLK